MTKFIVLLTVLILVGLHDRYEKGVKDEIIKFFNTPNAREIIIPPGRF